MARIGLCILIAGFLLQFIGSANKISENHKESNDSLTNNNVESGKDKLYGDWVFIESYNSKVIDISNLKKFHYHRNTE